MPLQSSFHLFIMEEQNASELQAQFERYHSIINKHQYHPIQGKILYHWKRAEETLLLQVKKMFPSDSQLLPIIRCLNALQELYSQKLIPVFYTYHTIASLLPLKESFLTSLEQQLQKVTKGESVYEQIALKLSLQESLLNSLIQKQRNQQESTQSIEQLRKIHILTIFKINQWQKKTSLRLGHPVFFVWNQRPYLMTLAQMKPTQTDLEGFKTHLQIHQIFQNTKSFETEDLSKQCLNILKSQKGKQLEMILNLPAFANVKTERHNNASSSASVGNLSRVQFKINKMTMKPIKSNSIQKTEGLEGLGHEQLEIIKKFRSFKKISLPRTNIYREKERKQGQIEKLIDSRLKDRIVNLKERVKSKQKINNSRETSKDLVKPHDKSIRFLYEKEVDLSQASPSKTKEIINSLMSTSRIQLTSHAKQYLTTSKDGSVSKLMKLQSEMNILASINSKKKEQIDLKHQNLKSLKLQLMEKVKSRSNSKRKIKNFRSTSFTAKKQMEQQKQAGKVKQSTDPIKAEVEKQRKIGEQHKKSLIQTKEEVSDQISRIQSEYNQHVSQKQRNHMALLQKQQKVNYLKDKFQKSSQFQDSVDDALTEEANKLKMKKKMEYDLQKQKITSISQTLSQRVKEEQKKYEQLRKREEQKERILKQRLQKEVELVRQEMERQTQQLKRQVEQQQLRRKEYEQKIALQREQNERMLKQIREWSHKQQQLLSMLEEQKQKRDKRQLQQRMRRKAVFEAQLQELQSKQLEIVKEYKSSNKNLMAMLETLKHKNYELQNKLIGQ